MSLEVHAESGTSGKGAPGEAHLHRLLPWRCSDSSLRQQQHCARCACQQRGPTSSKPLSGVVAACWRLATCGPGRTLALNLGNEALHHAFEAQGEKLDLT